jgi:hypothetical protein
MLQPYLLANRHGISEFSMASLYPFTKKRDYKVSSFKDNDGTLQYVIIGTQKKDDLDEYFAMLPGGSPGSQIFHQLTKMVSEVNTISEQKVPGWKEFLGQEHLSFSIVEDRDNADYIYEKQSLIDLVGQTLHKKLAHVNKFIKEHPERILLPSDIAPKEDMLKVLSNWADNKDTVEDYQATKLAIDNQEKLQLTGSVLYSKDTPIAFTLGENDNDRRFIIHIEKALTQYKGVYQYINRAFASELHDSIVEINREQDLGIPGLRQAKMTYQPSSFLMKYKLRFD